MMTAQEARNLHQDSQEYRYNRLLSKIKAAAATSFKIAVIEEDVRGLRSRLSFDKYKLKDEDGQVTISWAVDDA
jgi:hypothetical protein